jgi:fructose-1-phosphate kinase PfkB-like protein
MKRHAMQTNPQVCFEVEPVDDFDHLAQLRMAAESAEFVVVSGSLPPGVSADYYQRVACGNASDARSPPSRNSWPPHTNLLKAVAQVVFVSLGSHGALLATQHASQRFSAIPMRGGSGVGAGDAMVAAIVVGLSRGWAACQIRSARNSGGGSHADDTWYGSL